MKCYHPCSGECVSSLQSAVEQKGCSPFRALLSLQENTLLLSSAQIHIVGNSCFLVHFSASADQNQIYHHLSPSFSTHPSAAREKHGSLPQRQLLLGKQGGNEFQNPNTLNRFLVNLSGVLLVLSLD